MIVIHNVTYNPRIDFLVCKNMIANMPPVYDDLKLRKCFWEECAPSEDYEKTLVDIKKYFLSNDLSKFTTQDIYNLYSVLTKETVEESISLITEISGIEDVVNLANLVSRTFVANKPALFQITLLVNYSRSKKLPLIPYYKTSQKLYGYALQEDKIYVQHLLNRLLVKLDHYCHKHTLQDNERAVKCLYHNSTDFLETVGAKALYFYGSLAMGRGNEYSDLDLMAIFPDGSDLTNVEMKAKRYWVDKIQIPFDILVTTESDLDMRTTNSMKATMRKVEGK